MKRWSWRLLGGGAIVVAVVLMLFGAALGEDEQFDRIVGWSTIIGALIGAVGLWFVFFPPRTPPERSLPELADALAERALEDEGSTLNELLYAGQSPGRAAELSFYPEVRFGVGPADATLGSGGGTLGGVAMFFREHTGGRMVILGAPGAGKTVLALTLLCQLARIRQDATARDRVPVPIRFDLARWNPSEPLREWLASDLQVHYSNLSPDQAEELVAQHLVLPILDGLDETDPEGQEPTRARAIVERLNRYGAAGGHLLPLVVTCREHVYQRLGVQIADAVTVTIRPLGAADVTAYLDRELTGPTGGHAVTALRAHPRSAELWTLAGAPWILTLLTVYLRDGGPIAALLPADEEKPEDYQPRATSLLLERYMPARVRASHDPKYTPDQVRRWSTALAVNLGTGVDISLTRVWPIGGHRLVRRLHVLLTTIILLALLSISTLGVNGWDTTYLDYSVRLALTHPTQMPRGWWISTLGAVALGIYLLIKAIREAASLDPRLFQRPMTQAVFRTARGRRRLFRSLARNLAVGLAVGLAVALMVALMVGPEFGLTVGLTGGLAIGLTVGLTEGLESEDLGTVTPASMIYSDVAVGLTGGLGIGLALALALGLTVGPAFGLTRGLAVGLALGLAIELAYEQAWLRYLLGVTVAAFRRRLPVPLIPFLDWGANAGILRRSGPFYQFRHLSLRNHLQRHPGAGPEALDPPVPASDPRRAGDTTG